MSDLIRRSDAIKVIDRMKHRLIGNGCTYEFIRQMIEELPTIEPKRGAWIVHKERTVVNDGFVDFFPTEYECSNCGLKQSMYFINSKPSNFCPNCGADMREREGE